MFLRWIFGKTGVGEGVGKKGVGGGLVSETVGDRVVGGDVYFTYVIDVGSK